MKSIFSKRRGTLQLRAKKPHAREPVDVASVDVKTDVEQPEPHPTDDPAGGNATDQDDSATANGNDRVEDLGSIVDACHDHPGIEALLDSLQTLKVLVSKDGVVYHVDAPSRVRALNQVLTLTKQELGRAISKPISLLSYSKLRSQAVRSQHESVSHNDLVDMVLHDAIVRKASDVYIAVHTDRSQIHFRTHGVRYLHSEISSVDGGEMARALWSLAPKGQHNREIPTDASFGFGGYRFRANSMPDIRGNSIVLRMRDPGFIPPLNDLGYSKPQQRQIDELQWSAGGYAVISGETNSGKSTTLTSLMAGMPDTEMIIEIADPIEIVFDHVTQVEFDHYAENAEQRFRDLLAALVRQNPDTLFIGEVRDRQTATAATDMSLQGKRVWGSVHSHSCLNTISRLEHLGIDVNLLAQPGFLNGVINQSLVPIVCEHCGMSKLDDDVLTTRLQHKYDSDTLRFHNPDGCSHCVRGISGQTVVAEIMTFSRDPTHPAREYIRKHDLGRLASCMREDGMSSKAAHAVTKIQQGLLDPILTEKTIGRIGTRDKLPEDLIAQTRMMSMRHTPRGAD